MAVQFEFAPVPAPAGKLEKLQYYPRVVNRKTVSTEDFAQEIESACTLTRTDVMAVLHALNNSLVRWLKDGQRVHIDGIGYFDVSLTCPETTDPKKTRASSVRFKSVNFRADKALRYSVAGLKAERSKAGNHSAGLSEIAIDMKLTEYFTEHDFLTRSELQCVCQMTRATAVRCLNRLMQEGKIKNANTKAQPVYVPVPGHYRRPLVSHKEPSPL